MEPGVSSGWQDQKWTGNEPAQVTEVDSRQRAGKQDRELGREEVGLRLVRDRV
jgi:hypothetical protein